MTEKRFDEILEEEGIPANSIELASLVDITRKMWEAQMKLSIELVTYRSNNPPLWDTFRSKLREFQPESWVFALPFAAIIVVLQFVLVGWLVLIILQIGPTGKYFLKSVNDRQGTCAQVYREIDWAMDEAASECFADTFDALIVLQILQGGQSEQEDEDQEPGETAQGKESQESSPTGQVREVPGHGTKLEVKEISTTLPSPEEAPRGP